MLTFTLAITCLTIQFALIYGPNIPCSYAILLFTASDFTSITSHIHNWEFFLLWLHLLFFLELFLHSSPVAYWAPTDLGRSSFSVLSFCLFILFMGLVLKARIRKWFAIPFFSWTTFCQNSPPRPIHLRWPYMAWLSFTELEKAVVHVTRLASFL